VAGSYDFSAQTEALTISGGSASDTITGGADADRLLGFAGNDLLVASDLDAVIDGGDGTDTVRFAASVAASNLASADLVNVEVVVIGNAAAGSYDFSAPTEPLTISGGSAGDTITGGGGADTLLGLTGDDVLVASDLDGRIDGGIGIDTVEFRASVTAANLADGDLANVEIVAIGNAASASYDFSAQAEALTISGGAAADTITGGGSADRILGGDANDVLFGGLGDDLLFGDAGHDILEGGAGHDILEGGAGNDVLRGGAGNDTFRFGSDALSGSDVIEGLDGGDIIDLSALLSSLAGTGASLNDRQAFIRFDSVPAENAVSISIDQDGSAGAFAFAEIARISGTLDTEQVRNQSSLGGS
jgi:Ca2+-binding RTX toxin-like protein